MANKYKVISKKYFNQYRNGNTFTLNLTEFTERLQGNVGETIKLEEVIEVGTIVNQEQGTEQIFLLSDSVVRGDFYDYHEEGLYIGAAVLFELNGTTATATIEGITNNGSDLIIDSTGITNLTNAGWEQDEIRTDVVIKVTTAPTYLLYKYGINPNDRIPPNYQSPLDGAEQSYQLTGITALAQPLKWSGKEIGSDMGAVTVKFDATRENYKHQFTLTHTFVIPYYVEGQLENIQNDINPSEFKRNSSVKYGNGFYFGGDKNNTTLIYQDTGNIGNVGYFGDNFNGFENFYTIDEPVISNPSNTGKLEVTEANTVTFSITSITPIGFVGSEDIILYHSKLPAATDYANKATAFDDIWVRSQIKQTEGAGAVASGVFSAVTVTLNAGKLDVSFIVTYTPSEQALFDKNTAASLFFTIATQNLTDPDNTDRVNVIVKTSLASKDTQVSGLVTDWQPRIYQYSEFASGTSYTDFNGWNGDLNGETFSFKTDVSKNAIVTKAIFRVVADNGTGFFQLFSQSIPLPNPQTVNLFGENFQVLNVGVINSFNLPSNEVINQISLRAAIPLVAATEQVWTGGIGFQVSWREWIENLAVPPTFIDYAEPNDNRNNKSSNYSGALGYDIKTILTLVVENDGATTEYDLLSDSSVIEDFDTGGGTFVGTVKTYDSIGAVDNLFTNEDVRIEIEFAHALGVLVLGDLDGMIWIEADQGTAQPHFLSSVKDYTSSINPLVPTDTLITGNATLVEVISINNLVTLICKVDSSKLTEGQSYNIYGRLDAV